MPEILRKLPAWRCRAAGAAEQTEFFFLQKTEGFVEIIDLYLCFSFSRVLCVVLPIFFLKAGAFMVPGAILLLLYPSFSLLKLLGRTIY